MNGIHRAHGAAYDCAYTDSASTCFEGTRTEILAKINDWIYDTGKQQCVFWLSGLAGVGKSTIARTISEQAAEKKILGGSFFFSRGDDALRNASLVFPSLAYQLAHFDPKIEKELANVLRDDADIAHGELQKQFQKLIIQPLEARRESNSIILLVLDALDECASGISQILHLFLTAPSLPNGLRIFVTSRPESRFARQLRKDKQVIEYDTQTSIVGDDIRRFLRYKIDKIFDDFELPRPDDGNVDQLAMKAGNLFIFATTALRFIDDMTANDPQGRLEIILGERDGHGASPYVLLDKLYLQALEQATSSPYLCKESIEKEIRLILGTIVTLHEPLSITALAEVLGLKESHIMSTLRLLQSIILVPSSPNQMARIFHPSFADFITSQDRCTDERFRIDLADQNAHLANRCLLQMLRNLHQNMIEIPDPRQLNEEVDDLDKRVKDKFTDGLEYACLYWTNHVKGTVEFNERIEELLHIFTSQFLLNWIEVRSLLKSIPKAIENMRDVYTWSVSNFVYINYTV